MPTLILNTNVPADRLAVADFIKEASPLLAKLLDKPEMVRCRRSRCRGAYQREKEFLRTTKTKEISPNRYMLSQYVLVAVRTDVMMSFGGTDAVRRSPILVMRGFLLCCAAVGLRCNRLVRRSQRRRLCPARRVR